MSDEEVDKLLAHPSHPIYKILLLLTLGLLALGGVVSPSDVTNVIP